MTDLRRLEGKLDEVLARQPTAIDRMVDEWSAAVPPSDQAALDAFRSLVAHLDDPGDGPEGDIATPTDAPLSLPSPTPRPQLPKRQTHGGKYGPVVRRKLLREARLG